MTIYQYEKEQRYEMGRPSSDDTTWVLGLASFEVFYIQTSKFSFLSKPVWVGFPLCYYQKSPNDAEEIRAYIVRTKKKLGTKSQAVVNTSATIPTVAEDVLGLVKKTLLLGHNWIHPRFFLRKLELGLRVQYSGGGFLKEKRGKTLKAVV